MTHHVPEVVRLLESSQSPSSGKLANVSTAPFSTSTLASVRTDPSITSAFGDRRNSHSVLDTSSSSGGAMVNVDTWAPKDRWDGIQSSSTLSHLSCL